jgi:hypothetical protein
MGQAIPRQHSEVVLRSHFRQLRALLALALVVVAALSAAVVFVATDDETTSTVTSSANPGQSIEYGGFNPQTGRPLGTAATSNIPKTDVAKPDESKIAAAIWRAQQGDARSGPGGPDESSVAAAIGR